MATNAGFIEISFILCTPIQKMGQPFGCPDLQVSDTLRLAAPRHSRRLNIHVHDILAVMADKHSCSYSLYAHDAALVKPAGKIDPAIFSKSLRKYRIIKVVSWRVIFSSGVDADFAGLLGSSARKTVQRTVFSENGSADPGGIVNDIKVLTLAA